MKNETLNILLIDDHPLIVEAYRHAFEEIAKTPPYPDISIEEAHSCDTALHYINNLKSGYNLDIVFLDIKLPPATSGSHLSGEDLGLEIKKRHPNTKIVIATTFNNNYRIHNIFQNIDPDGFFIKSDVTTQSIIAAIRDIISDPPFYSKSVLRSLRKYVSQDFMLDKWDRKMLYELSQGTRMNQLPKILPLSIATLEKRKRHLKEIFDVEEGDDRDLLIKAREQGFI